MAVYKVIQDVEAEDKIVGFLTLKSFIYAIIAVALAYINFRLAIASTIGPLRFVFVLVFFFPMLIFGVLAAPLGRDQPTEVWILSHVRFFLKSRKRIWDQSGVQELVTITAPKKAPGPVLKNLSQSEVRSRLKALATTLDSRGWAVRNVAINLNAYPSYLDVPPEDSDRLVSADSIAQGEPTVGIQEADDIMDVQNNPTAQYFDDLMQKADAERKEKVQNRVNEARAAQQKNPEPISEPAEAQPDYGFLDQVPVANKKSSTTFVGHKIINPTAKTGSQKDFETKTYASDEQGFLERLHDKAEFVHKHSFSFKPKTRKKHGMGQEALAESTIERQATTSPTTKQAPALSAANAVTTPSGQSIVTAQPQNAKLKELMEVAKNDKLSTLSAEAKRESPQVKKISPSEFEIDLR